jgi:poly(A) polymerase
VAKSSPNRDAAVTVIRTLRQAGHIAYFAGGCVRDELLGNPPDDYDVATDAIPPRIAELFPRSNHVGAAFGVMLVSVGKSVVEVATFRADGRYTDKRRPDSVTFSDPVADAQRRDFTVNALFIDPTRPGRELAPGRISSGEVIDHVGGLADLQARVLRAVGDPEKRLAEDHLRALRAARLAAKLGFEVDARTAGAIRVHASELAGVSRERIGEELRKMLAHPARARAAALIEDLGLDGPITGAMLGPPRSGVLAGIPPGAGFETALAAWAIQRGLAEERGPALGLVPRWRDTMCLSNDERALFEQTLLHVILLRREWSGLGCGSPQAGSGPARV